MKKYRLELEEGQLNYILNVLGDKPYKETYQLIHEIQAQANNQVEETKLEVKK